MKATFITLGLLLATTQARTLKSLIQANAEQISQNPLDYGFPANCVITEGPGGPGNPPVVVTVPECECTVAGNTGSGLPPLSHGEYHAASEAGHVSIGQAVVIVPGVR